MNQDKTVNRVLNEMEFAELVPRDKKRTARKQYLHQVYAAGFDAGRMTFSPSKPILKFSMTGEYLQTYSSLREAAKDNNISSSNISMVAHGKRRSAGGFYWRYE